MTISQRVDGRRYRRGRSAVILLIVVGLGAFGYWRFDAWRDRPSETRRIAESVTVAGFVRTAVVDEADGDNPSDANAYFIGPAPKPDAVTSVSVPTIRLSAVPPPYAPDLDDSGAPPLAYPVAKDERRDGCGASVSYPTEPASDRERSSWRLTAEQLDGVRRGTDVLVRVLVYGCG